MLITKTSNDVIRINIVHGWLNDIYAAVEIVAYGKARAQNFLQKMNAQHQA